MLWAALLLSLLLGLGVAIFAAPLGRALAGGGRLAAGLVPLLRWVSLAAPLLTLGAFASGWLQAEEHFALPAFIGLPFDAAVVLALLILGRFGALAARRREHGARSAGPTAARLVVSLLSASLALLVAGSAVAGRAFGFAGAPAWLRALAMVLQAGVAGSAAYVGVLAVTGGLPALRRLLGARSRSLIS